MKELIDLLREALPIVNLQETTELLQMGDSFDLDNALAPRIQQVLEAHQQGLGRVRKEGGSYQHTGTVLARFNTVAGLPRLVMEFDPPVAGCLHIFNPDQVRPLVDEPVTRKETDEWDSCRKADYDQGWNDCLDALGKAAGGEV